MLIWPKRTDNSRSSLIWASANERLSYGNEAGDGEEPETRYHIQTPGKMSRFYKRVYYFIKLGLFLQDISTFCLHFLLAYFFYRLCRSTLFSSELCGLHYLSHKKQNIFALHWLLVSSKRDLLLYTILLGVTPPLWWRTTHEPTKYTWVRDFSTQVYYLIALEKLLYV